MALLQTPLHDLCREEGGRMVPFAGWEMPVQFSGLIQEHKAVRERMGMFDISHMGVLRLEGPTPKDALQQLVPTDLHRMARGSLPRFCSMTGGITSDRLRLRCCRRQTGLPGPGDQRRLR